MVKLLFLKYLQIGKAVKTIVMQYLCTLLYEFCYICIKSILFVKKCTFSSQYYL